MGARSPLDSAKAARLTSYRTCCASAFVSGLRSEYPSPPRPALAGPWPHRLARRIRNTAASLEPEEGVMCAHRYGNNKTSAVVLSCCLWVGSKHGVSVVTYEPEGWGVALGHVAGTERSSCSYVLASSRRRSARLRLECADGCGGVSVSSKASTALDDESCLWPLCVDVCPSVHFAAREARSSRKLDSDYSCAVGSKLIFPLFALRELLLLVFFRQKSVYAPAELCQRAGDEI
ncbi:uncharacterized protein C8Q71DRAFT_743503 [Rhodofomes roseus]|uniref:Uncharacterized protein n=1 Tax=Rhodofomes roseus TaxID=34475 RepID=A0ABQ8KR57_9APHY|nr:uncharacterized protein C8Q71DRAFT_743503 [Rhodofomes roseus]KAH9841114.1 hypothetical protein C8Q71DRAFT_743503 [Rhodofomes roseus]